MTDKEIQVKVKAYYKELFKWIFRQWLIFAALMVVGVPISDRFDQFQRSFQSHALGGFIFLMIFTLNFGSIIYFMFLH